jgi:basic membrane protein A
MTTNFSRREFILLGSAGFGASLLLQACSNSTTPTATTTGGTEGFKIAIDLPGTITDKGWNQSGYEEINCTRK